MVKAVFVNRVSIGFSDEQFEWLTEQVRKGKAENLAQLVRSLVNEKSLEAKERMEGKE